MPSIEDLINGDLTKVTEFIQLLQQHRDQIKHYQIETSRFSSYERKPARLGQLITDVLGSSIYPWLYEIKQIIIEYEDKVYTLANPMTIHHPDFDENLSKYSFEPIGISHRAFYKLQGQVNDLNAAIDDLTEMMTSLTTGPDDSRYSKRKKH